MPERIEKPISKEEFDSIIEPYKDQMIVQNVGLSYGSMIYFLMDKVLHKRDDMLELTLWGWYWRLFKDKEEICSSETITRKFAETVLSDIMKQSRFEGAHILGSKCTLSFSNGVRVFLEQRPEVDDSDDLFFLSLVDNRDSILILTNDIPPQFKIGYNSRTSARN